MEVKLLSHSLNAEKICAAAAKGCYSQEGSSEIFENISNERMEKVLKNVIKRGHVSVIEHANFTFSISGVSRALTHQLVRHRIASYSQQSQRYVTYDDIDFVIPPSIQSNENISQKFRDHITQSFKFYKELVKNGIEAEDARFIFPNATCTAITVTMNARELLHFFRMRTCTKAQWEIREMAEKMLELVKNVAPTIFENAGPSCVVSGICPEETPCSRLQNLRI